MFPPNPTGSSADDLVVASHGIHDTTVTAVASQSEEVEVDADFELLSEAQEQFRRCVEWESESRRRWEEELNFVDGLEHWDGAMKEERKGRPCLTFDRIGPSVDQVVNDARQTPPEAKISPVGGGADKETAEILQGLIRNIDQDSSASIAYLTAYEHAVKIGRGWWRVHFEFENDEDFVQKIVVKRVANPFSVYPDPAAEEFDYSDMMFCFVTEDLDKETYRNLYPESKAAGTSNFEGVGDKIRKEWFRAGTVRIAEYWWVEKSYENIVQLADGRILPPDQVPPNAETRSKRKVEKRQIKGAKINGMEVLERWDWPGKWIPIIPVLGKEIIKEGKRQLRGMVRAAMDANLYFDYLISKEAETVGLGSIVQWLVAEGQIENFEYQWTQANRKALPFLEYKTEVAGKPVPPPVRIFSEPPLGAITGAIAHSDEAGKSSLATWNPSLGAPSPEASGRAITARQRESDNAHFNYHDNLGRSMKHSARVELDLAPHVYSEERMITILDPDGSNRQVKINAPFVEKGLQKIYKITPAARYDVTMGSGQSYASRRAEGADRLVQVAQFMPVLSQRAPDLIIQALDLPDGDQIAERIRPPDVKADADETIPIPPQIQAQMGQMQQALQVQGATIQALEQVIKNKIVEMESKERQVTQTNQTGILKAEIASKSALMNQIAEQTHDLVTRDLERRAQLLHSDQTVEQDAAGAAQPSPAGSGNPPAPAGPGTPGGMQPPVGPAPAVPMPPRNAP